MSMSPRVEIGHGMCLACLLSAMWGPAEIADRWAVAADEASVRFELTEDAVLLVSLSSVPGGPCRGGGTLYVYLRGEFVARLGQGERSVGLAIQWLEFTSVPEESYTITGTGSYGESSPQRWIAVPENFANLDLRVQINGWSGLHLYSELAGSGVWFPRIHMTASEWPLWAQPDRCFLIVLAARPSEEDGPRFFRRGDLNGDRNRSILDAMLLLRYLFLGEAESFSCEDSGDVNDDGALDLADVVHLLGHLFLGRAPPAPPLAFCGLDLTDDELGCGGQIGCLADTG